MSAPPLSIDEVHQYDPRNDELFGGDGGFRLSRLSLEYSKLKSRSAALEKQISAERRARENVEKDLSDAQRVLRSQETQIETLTFNVHRLTKRCEKLMQKIKHAAEVLKKRSAPNQSWMSSLFEGSWGSGSGGSDARRMASQLQVTQEELRAKIEENERLHIDAFELEQEHKTTLETVQRKIEDLKNTLAERERDLATSRTDTEQATQRFKACEHEAADHIKELTDEVQRVRAEMEDKEETLNLVNKQLDTDLRSIQQRYSAKITFDDNLHDKFNALNLPPFDRVAVVTKISLLRDFSALSLKLKVHLSSLARSYINKLSLPVKPMKLLDKSLYGSAALGLGFGSESMPNPSESLEEDREQHALLLSLVTLPTELEAKCDDFAAKLQDLAAELDRQANLSPWSSQPRPSTSTPSVPALLLKSLSTDGIVSSLSSRLQATSPSTPVSSFQLNGHHHTNGSPLTPSTETGLPPLPPSSLPPPAVSAPIVTLMGNGTRDISALHSAPFSSPRSPSSEALSSLTDSVPPFSTVIAASLPTDISKGTSIIHEDASRSASVSAGVLRSLQTLLECCRRLVLAELDVLEHQKHTESKVAARLKLVGSPYLFSLGLLVQRYRELLALVQSASSFIQEVIDLQAHTHQTLTFYCGWLFDFILLGGSRTSDRSASSPHPAGLLSPGALSPSRGSTTAAHSPTLLLSIRRCITSISAQFAATVSALEHQQQQLQKQLPLSGPGVSVPSVPMPSKAIKVMYNAIVSESSSVSKLVLQLADRVVEYRRVLMGQPGQSRRHAQLYARLTLARFDSDASDSSFTLQAAPAQPTSTIPTSVSDTHPLSVNPGDGTASARSGSTFLMNLSETTGTGRFDGSAIVGSGSGMASEPVDAALSETASTSDVMDPSPNGAATTSFHLHPVYTNEELRFAEDSELRDSESASMSASGSAALPSEKPNVDSLLALNGTSAPIDTTIDVKMLQRVHERTFSYLRHLSFLRH